jgi:predicted nuclease of predicted toxin-antitoxin system
MKFIVDAQLSRKFVIWLNEAGHDALHTLELPKKNLTSDMELTEFAVSQGRIVVSKDDDFVQAYLINGEPSLLLISTGNISNLALEALIKSNLKLISDAFLQSRFVELTFNSIVIHE